MICHVIMLAFFFTCQCHVFFLFSCVSPNMIQVSHPLRMWNPECLHKCVFLSRLAADTDDCCLCVWCNNNYRHYHSVINGMEVSLSFQCLDTFSPLCCVSLFSCCTLTSCLLRHSKKRSKFSDDANPKKPFAATSTSARAFFSIKVPKMPQAKTKSNLRPESNLELNTRDSWRNCDPNGEYGVSAYLGVRESKFKVRVKAYWMLASITENEAGAMVNDTICRNVFLKEI